MQNQVAKFKFNRNPLTTITDENGEHWFVAKEVCTILRYAQVASAIRNHCKCPKT